MLYPFLFLLQTSADLSLMIKEHRYLGWSQTSDEPTKLKDLLLFIDLNGLFVACSNRCILPTSIPCTFEQPSQLLLTQVKSLTLLQFAFELVEENQFHLGQTQEWVFLEDVHKFGPKIAVLGVVQLVLQIHDPFDALHASVFLVVQPAISQLLLG